MGVIHSVRTHEYGCYGVLPSHLTSPLGRILEQVLQGKWSQVYSILLQKRSLRPQILTAEASCLILNKLNRNLIIA